MAIEQQDFKEAGVVTYSTNLELPFLPRGSTQGQAIINGIVRVLDEKVLDKVDGTGTKITLEEVASEIIKVSDKVTSAHVTVNEDLVAKNANITGKLTAQDVQLAGGSATNLTITTLESDKVTSKDAELTNLEAGTVSIETLTIQDAIEDLKATEFEAEIISADEANIEVLNVEVLNNLNSTNRFPINESIAFNPTVNQDYQTIIELPFSATRIKGTIFGSFTVVGGGTTEVMEVVLTVEDAYVYVDSVREYVYSLHELKTVTTHSGRALNRGVGFYRGKPLIEWGDDDIALTSASLTGFLGRITVTADTGGVAGNDIRLLVVSPDATSATLNIVVVGDTITLEYVRAVDGTIVPSSYSDIVDAINNDADASALISASYQSTSDITDTILTLIVTPEFLSGGLDAAIDTNLLAYVELDDTGQQLTLRVGLVDDPKDAEGVDTGDAEFIPDSTFTITDANFEFLMEAGK